MQQAWDSSNYQTLSNKKAVLNVDCPRACFKYAVLSVLHYNDLSANRQRITKYERWENKLKIEGIDADDVDIKHDIPKNVFLTFLAQNPESMPITEKKYKLHLLSLS